MSILEGELAAEIADAMADVFIPATVTRMLPGGGPPWDPGPPIADPHTCRGIVDDYDVSLRDGTGIIEVTDRKVVILATSLAITPEPGNTVTIRGETGTIVHVGADPALATYECQTRF